MSIGSFSSLDHVVVKLFTDDGPSGEGEATVVAEFMHETRGEMLSELQLISAALLGADPGAIDEIHERIDRVAPNSQSARAAVDEACHDAVAKAGDFPAWKLLGVRQRESIPCTWIIGLMSVEDAVEEALDKHMNGFTTFKIKIGHDDDKDIEVVRALREALGKDALIRLDANGAYPATRALRVLSEMSKCDLEMVEQPCRGGDLGGMARIREELGVKVLADESVFSIADAIKVIDAGAADFINIKVQKVGGLHPAHHVADVVEEAGLGCVIGSCLECGPGVAASAHFAVTCRSARFASDLCAGLQSSSSCEATEFGGLGPIIHEPRTPGLGFLGCA